MSSSHDRNIIMSREIDKASTVLIDLGVKTVKKNPIKVGTYLLGLLLCIFFTGFKVTPQQRNDYYQELQKQDHDRLVQLQYKVSESYDLYYQNKGWFSCNNICQQYKNDYDASRVEFERVRNEEEQKVAIAKSKLGLFSEYGVEETRNLFWEKFAMGKNFAKRQSTWDAIFYGIAAMGRDESLVEYIIRLGMNVLFNFTIGVFMAVVTFVFSLGTLIASFQASFLGGLTFFVLASVAAISFALSWLIGLYLGAAGTAYVGFKLISANMRIENGDNSGRGYRRSRVE